MFKKQFVAYPPIPKTTKEYYILKNNQHQYMMFHILQQYINQDFNPDKTFEQIQ